MPNMVHEVVGDLFVVIHRAGPPSDAEWDAYIAPWREHDMALMRTLVFTDGGAPNTLQRKKANEILAGRQSLTAVISSSPLVRGIVTSLSWFNAKIKAFAPEHADEGFRHLGACTTEERTHLWTLAERLRVRLGDPSLQSIAFPRTGGPVTRRM